MPDLAILDPRVLNGVIERMPPGDGQLGHALVPRQSWPDAYWDYDIISRRRNIARPNTPNSPAQIVDQNGVGKMRGGFLYTREKKVFTATTMRWLRTPGQLAASAAEATIVKEVQELRDRQYRWEEFLIWKMLASGGFNLSALGHQVAVDYQIAASHMPTVSTYWSSPLADIIGDSQDFKRLISRDSDARLTTFYGNAVTLETFYTHMQVQASLNDAQKGAFATEGILPRFQQITYVEYDRGYMDDFTTPSTPVFVPYIPDGYLVGIAEGGPETFAWLDGPSADWDAPEGTTGSWAKTWQEEDPSNRQALLESNGFPVLYQPDKLLIVRVF